MSYVFKTYSEDLLKKQVELIWEVGDNWKYPFLTSLEALTKKYTMDNFDPSTRFYAIDKETEQLIGYITSEIKQHNENEISAALRFPMVRNENFEIADKLYELAENRLMELGASKISAIAGEGMGNTMELANRYKYQQSSSVGKRAAISVDALQISGNTENVEKYNDSMENDVNNLFAFKIGLPEEKGKIFLQSLLKEKQRKENISKSRVSWQVYRENDEIDGLGIIHRSDRNPSNSVLQPIFFAKGVNIAMIIDRLLSSLISDLKPEGLKNIQTYISPPAYPFEPIYNSFGIEFDETYWMKKDLN